MKNDDLRALLVRIEREHPKSTLLMAMVLLELARAKNRSMAQPDLSEALGKGRDSSAIQKCVKRLVDMEVLTRERVPAREAGGEYWIISLPHVR